MDALYIDSGICSTRSGGQKFKDWEELYHSLSVKSILKLMFTFEAMDFMDPRVRDILEEIQDYHGDVETLTAEAEEDQVMEFNSCIEMALRRDPYGKGMPKGIPMAISNIKVDVENEVLTWVTSDDMMGDLSITSRQAKRLSKDASRATWTRFQGKWA